MDNLSPNKMVVSHSLEREFQREESELRRWLDANVTDPGTRKRCLEQLREDQVARGEAVWVNRLNIF